MVQAEVTLVNNPHSGVRAADFVGRTQGKLRDFYRIGKVLGTGKCCKCCISGEIALTSILAFAEILTLWTIRRVW